MRSIDFTDEVASATSERTGGALPHPPIRQQPALLRRIFADPQPVLDDLAARYGPIYGLGAGPVRMAVIGDPTALRELFALSPDHFRWGHKFNVLGFVVGGESMIVSDGPDHKRRRASVQSAFSRRRLNGWIPMIVERTDEAVDRIADGLDGATREIDLYLAGRALVLEIAIRSLFGERLSERAAEIGALFQRPQDYLESPAIRQLPHPVPGTRRARVRADRRAIDAIVDAEMARLRAAPSDDPLDVLATLVADGSLTDSEIRDQVVTLMGAGYDTTAASLSWMFWCISLTPGLWGRLRDEADAVLGPVGGETPPDERTLANLDLAARTVRETLRLHPAGAIAPREAATDIVVGGFHIPAGTLVLWSAHLAGRDERAWPDPLRFDPDRFIDPSPETRALADIAWVPFGRGARNCIGFALAQMELTLIVARLAQRLDVSAVRDDLPRPVGMVVNRPAGGAPMRVSERETGEQIYDPDVTTTETPAAAFDPTAGYQIDDRDGLDRPGPKLLIGTRKGLFVLSGADDRRRWSVHGPGFLGHIIQHAMIDPRDAETLLVAAKTGHLGPTVFRSSDLGRTWSEASTPPAFRSGDPHDRAVRSVFWLTPGPADEPGSWYAGASPQGLFRSDDSGATWSPVDGWNDHPNWGEWAEWPDVQGTPDGSMLHSVNIDPRDAAHLYIGLSGGGVFESTDGGKDWEPLNGGCAADFLPDPDVAYGHDPHCVRLHPAMPDRLYMQNHCGIYRLDRPATRWERIGDNMPRHVGDIGFPIELHPRDPDTAWVFPMDGTDVWPRTSPGGRPSVFRTRDAGATWEEQRGGLPDRGWWTVKRQAMTTDDADPVGLFFGTTSGEVWASVDEGETWTCLASHLPEIYSVEVATTS